MLQNCEIGSNVIKLILISFWKMLLKCYRSFLTLILLLYLFQGLSIAIPGPTLLDLQNIVQTDTSHIAYIYLARSSGYLMGSLIGKLKQIIH